MNALLPCDCTLPSDLHCHRNGTHPRSCCCCCLVRLFSPPCPPGAASPELYLKRKKNNNITICNSVTWSQSSSMCGTPMSFQHLWCTLWCSAPPEEKSVCRKHQPNDIFFFEKTSGKCRQTLALGLYCYTVFTPRLSGCPSVFRLILSVTDWRCETAEQEREQVEQGVLDTPTSTERSKMLGLPVVSTWVRGAEHVTPPEGFHRHTVTPRFLLRLTASTSAAGEPNGCCASDC